MKDARTQMRRRAELAEHPFGTLKCRAGYRHFLVRGFNKVRGEWSLMALCYNFFRVLTIMGVDCFIAYLATVRRLVLCLLGALAAAMACPTAFLARFRVVIDVETRLRYRRLSGAS
jgi:hypothetical protein